MTIADLTRYQYGALATQAKGNSQLGALEKQLLSMGGDTGDGFYLGALATEEGREIASLTYEKKYKKAFDESTLGDLFQYYENAGDFKLETYFSPQERRLLKTKISPYFNKKIKDLKDEINTFSKTLKNATGENGERVSEGDILNANTQKLLYSEILGMIQLFEGMKNSALEISAVKSGNTRMIKETKEQLMNSIYGNGQ